MAGTQQAPEGWYMLSDNPVHYGYYNGVTWARHRWLDPSGVWQEQILDPEVSPATEHPVSTVAEGSPDATGGSAWQRGESSPEPAVCPEDPALDGSDSTPAGSYPGDPPSYGIASVQRSSSGKQVRDQAQEDNPGQVGFFREGEPLRLSAPIAGSGSIELRLAPPGRQKRITVALRILLAIPNWLVLSALNVALSVVAVVLWLCSLISGRPSLSLWRIVRNVLQWQARLRGYLLLLTDQYPPFATGEVAYPVNMEVADPPGRYSRLSVLFRLVLAVPVFVMLYLLEVGMGLIMLAAWVVALFAGELPLLLHNGLAAFLRYSLRVYGYVYLLTTEYPGLPTAERPITENPPGDRQLPLFRLDQQGRRFLTGVMLWGLIVVAGWGALVGSGVTSIANNAFKESTMLSKWNAVAQNFSTTAAEYNHEYAACGQNVACEEHAFAFVAASWSGVLRQLKTLPYPSRAAKQDGQQVIADLSRERTLMAELSTNAGGPVGIALYQQLRVVNSRLNTSISQLNRAVDSSASLVP